MNGNNTTIIRVGCYSFSIAIGGFLTGAIRGFCDAHNTPIENKSLEFMLTWGPTLAGAAVDSINLGLIGMFIGMNEGSDISSGNHEIRNTIIGTGIGTAVGGAAGAAIGAAVGGLGTLVGYGTGYVCGKVF